MWTQFEQYQYVGKHRHTTLSVLDLKPGKSYRAVVKFCAEDLCYPPIYGNGVTIIVSPPTTGNVIVRVENSINHQV